MRKVLIMDTSVLCVWLQIPGKSTCGSTTDPWNKDRVEQKIAAEETDATTFVLPLATLIETGNHIAHAAHSRRKLGEALADLMKKSADQQTPWAAFSAQETLWKIQNLKHLADRWPLLAEQRCSLGDATIRDIAEYYAQMNCRVEILTGDQGLKAYEPVTPPLIPRRRKP